MCDVPLPAPMYVLCYCLLLRYVNTHQLRITYDLMMSVDIESHILKDSFFPQVLSSPNFNAEC